MKVVSILGSPRKKGITAQLASEFTKIAEEKGGSVKTHHLNSLNFQGCQGCNTCKTTKEECVLKDDLKAVLDDMKEADITIFATPVYYWDVSGQFKSFFDRTWSFVKADYKTNPDPVRLDRGKKALLITSQGDVEEKHKDVAQKYAGFLTMYGYDTEVVRAFGPGGMEPNTEIDQFIELVQEKAKQMI